MSTKYQNSKDVPLEVLLERLSELADAVNKGRETQDREFTIRIPAECDRDADIVIHEAVNRIKVLQDRVSEHEENIIKTNNEASDLRLSIWRKRYISDSSDYELYNSIDGLISQVDNMVASLLAEQQLPNGLDGLLRR